jgi:hypothetical protein
MLADPADAHRSMGRSIASGQGSPCTMMAVGAVSIASDLAPVSSGSAAA